MKYLRYLATGVLAILMVSFSSTEKRRSPTLPPENLLGHIHWIQSVSYHAIMDSSGSITKGAVISDTDISARMIRYGGPLRPTTNVEPPIEAWTYDEYGDQLEQDKYHANGKLYNKIVHGYYPNGDVKEIIDSGSKITNKMWKYVYKYDNSGNVLDSTEYYYGNNSQVRLYSREVNVYDSRGKLLEGYAFYNDTLAPNRLTLYKYNEKGQLTETDESRIADGNLKNLFPTEKYNFWYDKQGRITEKATYRFHEGLVKDVKTIFDSTGYHIETYSYTRNKVLTGSVVKSFFRATNTLQEDTYNADGMLTDYTISHLDSAKHLIDKGAFHINYHEDREANHKNANDTVMVLHIINDNHSNIVEEDQFSNEGKAISHKSYQYSYDNIGNWIDKVEFNGEKPVEITEREIGYFKD